MPSSSSLSVIGGYGERIRRPRSGQRKGHAFGGITAGEALAQLLKPRVFIALDEDVDLRKGAGSLLARFSDGVARQFLHHRSFHLGDDLLLGLARGALLLVVEFLAQQERFAGRGAGDLVRKRAQAVDALDQRLTPTLRIELDAQRPLLFAVEAIQ